MDPLIQLVESIKHSGVKGMKWGVRKSQKSSGSTFKVDPNSVAAQAARLKKKGSKGTYLTDNELQKFLNRQSLENRYFYATGNVFQRWGKRTFRDLVNTSTTSGTQFVNKQAMSSVSALNNSISKISKL